MKYAKAIERARALRFGPVLLAALASGVLMIRNEGDDSDPLDALNDDTINEYRQRQLALSEDSKVILAKLDQEKREPNGDEIKAVRENTAEIERIQNLIDMRAQSLQQINALATPQPRRTTPQGPGVDPQHNNGGGQRPAFSAGRDNGPGALRGVHARTHGFGHFGEFAGSVLNAVLNRGEVDKRLKAAAASTIATEKVGADGGYLVPPEFRERIMSHVFDENDLLGRTDQQIASRNSISFPVDETTPWGATGVQAYWESEAAAFTQSRPSFKELTLKLNKLTALVPVTDELLEDAPSLGNYLDSAVGRVFNYKIGNSIIDGTGAGEPLGFLRSQALVTVAAETQAADTVIAQNVAKMWTRMPAMNRPTAIWLINPDVEQQFITMTLGGTSVAIPIYMPPNGLSQSPFGTILGRPAVPHFACKALGDPGDINFVDLRQYVTAVKTGGMKSDVSLHLWFDQALAAFRFMLRIDGRPWPSQVITPPNSANTLSPFITLAARAG